MEKLVKDGAVSKTSSDSYNINKQKVFHFFPLLTHNFLHLLILSRVQLSEHSFMIRRCLIWNKFWIAEIRLWVWCRERRNGLSSRDQWPQNSKWHNCRLYVYEGDLFLGIWAGSCLAYFLLEPILHLSEILQARKGCCEVILTCSTLNAFFTGNSLGVFL